MITFNPTFPPIKRASGRPQRAALKQSSASMKHIHMLRLRSAATSNVLQASSNCNACTQPSTRPAQPHYIAVPALQGSHLLVRPAPSAARKRPQPPSAGGCKGDTRRGVPGKPCRISRGHVRRWQQPPGPHPGLRQHNRGEDPERWDARRRRVGNRRLQQHRRVHWHGREEVRRHQQ